MMTSSSLSDTSILRIFFNDFCYVENRGDVIDDVAPPDGIPLCVGFRVLALALKHLIVIDGPIGAHIRLKTDLEVISLAIVNHPDTIDHPFLAPSGFLVVDKGVDDVARIFLIGLAVNVSLFALMFLDIGQHLVIEGLQIRNVFHTLI